MTTMKTTELLSLPAHPFAAEWFELPDAELLELAQDIEANGLVHAIVLHRGEVLDGLNRRRALARLGEHGPAEVPVTEYTGDDPVSYILSANLRRRQLTAGQRAFMALKLLAYEEAQAKERMVAAHADPAALENFPELGSTARDLAGERLGVSGRSVAAARTLALGVTDAAREAAAKVQSGEWSLNEAVTHAKPAEAKTPDSSAYLDKLKQVESALSDLQKHAVAWMKVADEDQRRRATTMISSIAKKAETLRGSI